MHAQAGHTHNASDNMHELWASHARHVSFFIPSNVTYDIFEPFMDIRDAVDILGQIADNEATQTNTELRRNIVTYFEHWLVNSFGSSKHALICHVSKKFNSSRLEYTSKTLSLTRMLVDHLNRSPANIAFLHSEAFALAAASTTQSINKQISRGLHSYHSVTTYTEFMLALINFANVHIDVVLANDLISNNLIDYCHTLITNNDEAAASYINAEIKKAACDILTRAHRLHADIRAVLPSLNCTRWITCIVLFLISDYAPDIYKPIQPMYGAQLGAQQCYANLSTLRSLDILLQVIAPQLRVMVDVLSRDREESAATRDIKRNESALRDIYTRQLWLCLFYTVCDFFACHITYTITNDVPHMHVLSFQDMVLSICVLFGSAVDAFDRNVLLCHAFIVEFERVIAQVEAALHRLAMMRVVDRDAFELVIRTVTNHIATTNNMYRRLFDEHHDLSTKRSNDDNGNDAITDMQIIVPARIVGFAITDVAFDESTLVRIACTTAINPYTREPLLLEEITAVLE